MFGMEPLTVGRSVLELITTMDTIYQVPVLGSPFFYYNPETRSEERQYESFVPHPVMHQFQHGMQPMPCTPVYTKPFPTEQAFNIPTFKHKIQAQYASLQSPRPQYMRPTILIQQDHAPRVILPSNNAEDMYPYPLTPPLSNQGSAISSPAESDMVPTPTNQGTLRFDYFEGVKQGCEFGVQSEILAGDFMPSGSPALTPGTFFSFHIHSHIPSLNISIGREI